MRVREERQAVREGLPFGSVERDCGEGGEGRGVG